MNLRRTNRKRIKIFEEKFAKNLQNFMKNINLQIQEAQWISSKIIYTLTHNNQTLESQSPKQKTGM